MLYRTIFNLFLSSTTKATSCSFARQDLYQILSSLLILKFASASYILLAQKKESQAVPLILACSKTFSHKMSTCGRAEFSDVYGAPQIVHNNRQ